MLTDVVACPECDELLEAPPVVQGKLVRCPECRRVCALPTFILEVPANQKQWQAVQSGLAWTSYGALLLVLTLFFGIAALVGFAFLEVPENLDPDELSSDTLLMVGATVVLAGVGLCAVLPILLGCFRCLAVPVETRARSWLALSLASVMLSVMAWCAAFVLLVLMTANLLVGSNPPHQQSVLFTCFVAVAAGLGLLITWGHGVFLGRVARYWVNDVTASQVTWYLGWLFTAVPLLIVALALFRLLELNDARATFASQLILGLVTLLFVGRWLTLVDRVRTCVRAGLRA